MDLFLSTYSFEDPSRAYDIWVELSDDEQISIALADPEAADVMVQIDKQQRLVELEVKRENLAMRLREIDHQIASEDLRETEFL